MDEAYIFLVDLHQLLISLVLHGWLRVCSHGNQVGHTLKKNKKKKNYLICEQFILHSRQPDNVATVRYKNISHRYCFFLEVYILSRVC